MGLLSVSKAQDIIKKFSDKKILVIGDLMLDEFIWGSVYRISPEAPVPVVEAKRRSYMPGGAANVARNLRDLGIQVAIIGGVGTDLIGDQILEILAEKNIDTSGVLRFKNRTSTVKTRVIGQHQQIVRIDWEDIRPLESEHITQAIDYIRGHLNDFDAIIFEDYGKGVINQTLLNEVLKVVAGTKIITSLDPKKGNPLNLKGIHIATPNLSEACDALGIPEGIDDSTLRQIGTELLSKWGLHSVLITLGEHGMCLFEKNKDPYTISTVAREVFDVSGAGDTVIASLTAALVAGAQLPDAAMLSNYAAGVVVGKMGTASVKPDEIINAIRTHQKKM